MTKGKVERVSTILDSFFHILRRLLICRQELFIHCCHVIFDSSVLQTFSRFLGRISIDLKHFRVTSGVVIESSVTWSILIHVLSLGLSECVIIFEFKNLGLDWQILEYLHMIVACYILDLLDIMKCQIARLFLKFDLIIINFLLLLLRLDFVIVGEWVLSLGTVDLLRFFLLVAYLIPVLFEFRVSLTIS